MPDMATLNSNRAGATAIDIMSANYRLLLEGSQELFPTPTYVGVFASGPWTSGGKLVRSRPENIIRQGRVLCRDDSRGAVLDRVAVFEQKIEEIRRHGGSLIYTPEGGQAVTFDIESAQILSIDHSGVMLSGGNAPITFELTFLPFGRLAPMTTVANANGTGLLLEFDVPAPGGSVPALGELVIQDTATQARLFFEGGLESRYYDSSAAWPLIVDSGSMTALESASSQSPAGAYGTTVWRQTLSTSQKGIAYYQSSWIGRFRVKARVSCSATNAAIRFAYSSRGGTATFGAWTPITSPASQWVEADLGIASFSPPISGSHVARLDFYGKALSGSPTFDLDVVKLIPAERYWRANGGVGAVAAIRSGRYLRLRHDALETETATDVWHHHPAGIGSYLEIPREGGRIAVFAHRNDLTLATASGAYTPLGDSLRADLVVTPRVALLGA